MLACLQGAQGNKKWGIVKELRVCQLYVLSAIGMKPSYLNQRSSGIWDWAVCAFGQVFIAVPVSSTLGFLSLPLCWISFVFSFHHVTCHQIELPFNSTSTLQGQSWVVSDRLNLSQGTRDVRGMCNYLSSVWPQQRFEVAGQCYSSVTAQSFIWQAKESTPSRCDGGPTPKKRPQSIMASSF